ncbi:hypothetical protein [Lysobacter sp. Root916]|uniref:GAP1-N1 domain-containing protein n=1 Tax=Lysobacter sp. Root916 TaxID=1736606 RepID=UPI000A50DFA6|nr:hypothetical protein [Lysobacter sp. Root916]
MAELRASGIVIDQALHGYRQGHRLLSASTDFDPESEAQLLALSDLLTSEPFGLRGSYLSGYPLKSANKYVLARTWLAEGGRPGSVWTHSLLLDYASLSALDDVMPLLTLFQQPSSSCESSAYAIRLSVRSAREVTVDSYVPTVASDPRVSWVLRHLYGRAAVSRFVVPAGDAADDELLVMALWRQMWPGLRRDFAFFTKSTSALAEVPAGSALCFSLDSSLISDFNNSAQFLDQYEIEGFDRLQRDLPRRGPTRLRRFLGRYAYDAAKPRAAVPALAALFNERKKPRDALASFERLLGTYPGIDRLKRELLLVCINDRQDADSLVRALQVFANEPSFVSVQSLEEALSKSPLVVSNAARVLATVAQSPSNTTGHQAFIALARQLPLAVLASQASPDMRQRLLEQRPELAGQSSFWDVTESERMILMQQAISAEIAGASLLEGMGARLSSSEAETILAYEPNLAVPLCQMIGSGLAPLHAANGLGTVPDVLSKIARAGLSVSWEVLERVSERLVRTHNIGCASDWVELSQRLHVGPGVAHPYVLGQLFLAGLNSKNDAHLSLCERAFDTLWTISDQHPGAPRELTTFLCGQPMVRKEYFYPDILLGTAWARYRGSASGRVMALSAQDGRLGKLARYIRHCDGESALRRIALQLRSHSAELKVPLRLVEAALNDAMPFLSAKLPRSPKS